MRYTMTVRKCLYSLETIIVCNLLKEGVVGIFGPQISETVSHTQALCDRYDIPHIATRWDYRTRQDKSTINLYPHPDIIGEVIHWKLKNLDSYFEN